LRKWARLRSSRARPTGWDVAAVSGNVRSDDHVGHRPQRVVRGKRLGLGDVDRGAPMRPAPTASRSAAVSTMPPRAMFTSSACGRSAASARASMSCRVVPSSGTATMTASTRESTSWNCETGTLVGERSVRPLRSPTMTRAPKPADELRSLFRCCRKPRTATAAPLSVRCAPRPIGPRRRRGVRLHLGEAATSASSVATAWLRDGRRVGVAGVGGPSVPRGRRARRAGRSPSSTPAASVGAGRAGASTGTSSAS